MTTIELIKILQDNEKGGISHKPRNISLYINGRCMPNPQISLSSTGDGICGPEIDLDIEGEWFEEQPSEDCISRDDVDAYIAKLMSEYLYDEERTRLEEFSAYLWELPSVTPQRPKGKWIDIRVIKSFHYDGEPRVRCSRCGNEEEWSSNYCPNCGAYMREGEKDDIR